MLRTAATKSGRPSLAMRVLVTGSAGFIGSFVSQRLLDRGDEVIGLDNLNDYYDVSLKQARLARLQAHAAYGHEQADVADQARVRAIFSATSPDRVVHLAAQAGVRHSLEQPHVYINSNVVGFLNILEAVREFGTEHLLYASSSSVYGANTKMPFSVEHGVDHPVSLYAASKRSNELMAHSYSHLFGIPTTGLRFFTVYGPWGRPDMALFTFTQRILSGEPIDVYNFGRHKRDFTYIDDIVEGVLKTLDAVPKADGDWSADHPTPNTSAAPYRLYNIGSNNPVDLTRFITVLEEALGRRAEQRLLPMQPGDVPETYADVDSLVRDVGYRPSTSIEVGVDRFVRWYLDYYRIAPQS